jgi:glycosyltransferase involved in cell wall biosynthesis
MRIDRIVVINDLSVARGGATGLALLSARLFREQGIPVTYLCGDGGESAELAALGIETVALSGEHILTGNRRRTVLAGLHNAAAKTLIEDWIGKHDTKRTVYHVHGWSKILSPAIFIALSPVARRTILHAHDYFLACPNGAFYHYPSKTPCNCQPLSGECITTNCDRRSYAQKIWRMGRSARLRSILFHNGTLPQTVILLHEKMAPFFQKSRYPDLSLHHLRNPVVPYGHQRVKVEDNRDFFFIGRLAPEKGIEDAIEASIRAGVRLTIIGEGPLRESISAIGGNVHVLGWLDHHEIAARISSARAVLMPTRYPEPFGLVAMEASASGIPVVVSQEAYLADEIVSAGLGFACDTSNPAAFATTLRKLADMPCDEIRAMSDRAYRREARLATTPEEWRDRLLDHYAACLKEDAPGPCRPIPGDGALYDAV